MNLLEDFYNLIEEIFSYDSMEKFLEKISIKVNNRLGAERSTLFIYDSHDNTLKSIVFLAKIGEKLVIPLNIPSIAGYSFKNKKPLIVDDVSDVNYLKSVGLEYHECWKSIPEVNPTKNILSVPIIFNNNPIGVFVAVNKFPKFTKDDIDYVNSISKIIGVAFKNLEKQLELHYLNLLNQRIIDSISASIIVTDENFNIVYINEAFLQMTGFRYKQREVIGKNLFQIFGFFDRLKEDIFESVRSSVSKDFVMGILRIKVVPVFSNYLFEPKISNIIFIIES